MREGTRRASTIVLGIVLASGCHKQPEPAPTQVAAKDLTEYQAAIRKMVKDTSRAEQLVAMTNEFEKIVYDVAAQDKATMAKVTALNADYGATRAQYDSVLSRVSAARREAAQKLVALRMRMAADVTEAEWEQLKSARVRLFEGDLEAVQP